MENKKSLKVAVVVGVFPSLSETFITNQLRFLNKKNIELQILATRFLDYNQSDFNVPKELLQKAKVFRKVDLMPKSLFKRIIFATSVLFKFKSTNRLLSSFNVFKYGKEALNFSTFFETYYQEYFKIHSFDVVHIHFGDNAIHLKKQIKNFTNKVIITFHGYDVHKYDKFFYEELSNNDKIELTVNSKYTRHKVESLGFSQHIHILPVGLETNYFKPSKNKKHNKNFSILFVGRLIPLKGPLLAIKIFEKLLEFNSDVSLTIIGDGSCYDKCCNYIKNNKLSDKVFLLGSKTQSEIKMYLDKADVFLYPGIIDSDGVSEAQGLVLQEAQAMTLPVITSDVGGISDGLINNKTGFVIKEKDIDGFVSKILLLINELKLRQKMGIEARQFVIENYDSELLGEKLLNIYNNNVS